MHDGEEWKALELGDEFGKKKLGGKRIATEVALQVKENLNGAVGDKEGMDVGRSS